MRGYYGNVPVDGGAAAPIIVVDGGLGVPGTFVTVVLVLVLKSLL